MRTIPFEPEHLFFIDDYEGTHRLSRLKVLEIGAEHVKRGPCISIEYDAEIVACAGIHIQRPGIGESWVTICQRNHGPSILKLIREMLGKGIRDNNLLRVQAIIFDRPEFIRFEKFFGFEYEGRLRKIGPDGVDMLMFSRVI